MTRPERLPETTPAARPCPLSESLDVHRVLTTRLHVPPLRSGYVSRPRLLARLKPRSDERITLVSAPAGYGRTTLIVEWLAQPQDAAPIVLACQSGHRRGIAIAALRMLSWTNVRNLGGGVAAWATVELALVMSIRGCWREGARDSDLAS